MFFGLDLGFFVGDAILGHVFACSIKFTWPWDQLKKPFFC